MPTFLERREWAFDEDDDFEETPIAAPSDPDWPRVTEPVWLGFLKALGVGILGITLIAFVFVCIVMAIAMVIPYVSH